MIMFVKTDSRVKFFKYECSSAVTKIKSKLDIL